MTLGALGLLLLDLGHLARRLLGVLAGDLEGLFHHHEVDLAIVQIDAHHFDPHLVTQTVAAAEVLADQLLMQRVELVVVVGEGADVHQTVDVDLGQTHEEAETGDAGDDAVELVTHVIQHVLALEPVSHVAGGVIGAALGHGAVLAHRIHFFQLVVVATARRPLVAQVALLLLGGLILDRPVQDEVGIAADRRGEVRIRLQRQTEVADVVGLIDGLTHGAQQHGGEQLCIRAPFKLGGQVGKVFRLGLETALELQAQLGQEVTEAGEALFARAVVHPEQGGGLVLLDVAGGSHVRLDHALFDDLVGVVAHERHDTVDLALGVEDEAGLFALELHRTALMASMLERLVEVVELFDVTHQRLVLLTQLGIAIQDRRHLGVGHAGVGVHHRFVELVAGHAAGGGDGHLAHHAESVNLWVE